MLRVLLPVEGSKHSGVMGGRGAPPRPIDFSIPAGRIGAVERVGPQTSTSSQAKLQPAELDSSDCLLVSVMGCPDQQSKHVFTIGVDATLDQLHAAIAELHPGAPAFHRVIANGKLLSNVLVQSGTDAPAAEGGQELAGSFGMRRGDKIKAVVTLKSEAEDLQAQAAAEHNSFNGYLPFDEELARERRRAGAAPMYARKASASLHDFRFGFQRIEPLAIDPNTNQPYTHPPPEEARLLLERLANDAGIVAVMKKYEWSVGLLTELPPSLETGLMGVSDHCLLGLNKNKGEEILLRLRTSDCLSFRPYLSIRETLVHELTHNRYDDHDDKFWGEEPSGHIAGI